MVDKGFYVLVVKTSTLTNLGPYIQEILCIPTPGFEKVVLIRVNLLDKDNYFPKHFLKI